MVGAGSGTRFGGKKQFASLDGRRVVDHSLDVARQTCDGVVLVLPDDDLALEWSRAVDPAITRESGPPPSATIVVAGSSTRSGSVRAGLAAVPSRAGIIAVHDAARPLSGPDLWRAAIAAVRAGADGAIPTVLVTDTVKRIADDGSLSTVDRNDLVAVQTPQAFSAAVLRAAHASGKEATDDAALVEALGGRVVAIPGHLRNLKLTAPGDLAIAATLLALGPNPEAHGR